MIILIAGATHTGKTLLAQKLLAAYHYPYLSIDHLKMGLIRSGQTHLTPGDNAELTPYLWSIVREIIKTAIENDQNLIVEGCYIPFDWRESFPEEYVRHIVCRYLVMSPEYIRSHFTDIRDHASAIEARLDDSDLNAERLIRENQRTLEQCKENGCDYFLIEDVYPEDMAQLLFGNIYAPEKS